MRHRHKGKYGTGITIKTIKPEKRLTLDWRLAKGEPLSSQALALLAALEAAEKPWARRRQWKHRV